VGCDCVFLDYTATITSDNNPLLAEIVGMYRKDFAFLAT